MNGSDPGKYTASSMRGYHKPEVSRSMAASVSNNSPLNLQYLTKDYKAEPEIEKWVFCLVFSLVLLLEVRICWSSWKLLGKPGNLNPCYVGNNDIEPLCDRTMRLVLVFLVGEKSNSQVYFKFRILFLCILEKSDDQISDSISRDA